MDDVGLPALVAAQLVDKIGQRDFFDHSVQQLNRAMPHAFCVVILHGSDGVPTVLFDGLTPLGYGAGIQNYLDKTYQINPFFSAYKSGLQAGFHRMAVLSQNPVSDRQDVTSVANVHHDPKEELGFVTEGWPRGMQELLPAVPLDDGAVVEFSLSQKPTTTGVDRPVADWFQQVVPVLISAVRKHCEIVFGAAPHNLSMPTANMAGSMAGFDALSEREMDVVNLILAGHSSEAIGLHLDIALPTVKSHRRNIYKKLGISSQAELFALATRRAWLSLHPLG